MSPRKQPWEKELDRLERAIPVTREFPAVVFYHYPDRKPRVWTATIRMPDSEMHSGDGTTKCEALLLANIHWAMHGETK